MFFLKNVRKISNLVQTVLPTSFLFWVIYSFFLDYKHPNKLFGRQARPFFRFLTLYGRKFHFFTSKTAKIRPFDQK